MTLAEASRQAQLAMEHLRRDPDDEDAQAEHEDAQRLLSTLWLRHVTR